MKASLVEVGGGGSMSDVTGDDDECDIVEGALVGELAHIWESILGKSMFASLTYMVAAF